MTQSVYTKSTRTETSSDGWRMTQSVCTQRFSVTPSATGSCERLAEGRARPLQDSEMLLSRIRLRSSTANCYTPPALSRPLRYFSQACSNRHSLPNEVAGSYTKDASASVSLAYQSRTDWTATYCTEAASHTPWDNSDTARSPMRSRASLEQRLRLYKVRSSRCPICRFDRAVLSRLRDVKATRKALSVKVSKHPVCRRDPCRCDREKHSLTVLPIRASSMQATAAANRFAAVERCYSGIAISAAVALISQLLLSLVFTDCSRC